MIFSRIEVKGVWTEGQITLLDMVFCTSNTKAEVIYLNKTINLAARYALMNCSKNISGSHENPNTRV